MKNILSPFHLAFPVKDLLETKGFYTDILGSSHVFSASQAKIAAALVTAVQEPTVPNLGSAQGETGDARVARRGR